MESAEIVVSGWALTTAGLRRKGRLFFLHSKANGQEPYSWLRHVMERLPLAASAEDYEALLLWRCGQVSTY